MTASNSFLFGHDANSILESIPAGGGTHSRTEHGNSEKSKKERPHEGLNPGAHAFLDLGYALSTDENKIRLDIGILYAFNSRMSAGIGTGFRLPPSDLSPFNLSKSGAGGFPIYGDFRYFILEDGKGPMVAGRAGALTVWNTDAQVDPKLFLGCSLTYLIPLSQNDEFVMGVYYEFAGSSSAVLFDGFQEQSPAWNDFGVQLGIIF